MSLSPSSDSDGDEDRETLKRILAMSGCSPIEIPADPDSESDSSVSDVQDWFRQIQEKFSMTSADADPFPVIKPLNFSAPSESDDEDVVETMAAIHRRFDQYQNVAVEEHSQILLQETNMVVTDVTLGQEIPDILSKDLQYNDQLPDPGFTELHQAIDGSCDLSAKALMHSQFPKSAQNFVDALKKNRSCQRFTRRKLIEIEAKIEENRKLKERIKCLMDFQLSCKKKINNVFCQKRDPRVRLISMRKPSRSKTMKVQTDKKFPALYFGPAENSHVSKYKMVMKKFPVSFSMQPWSNIEKENLAKGLKQQYQEMLLLNSMNFENDSESSMNPDLISAVTSNDLEVTPEKIRSFLPLVNWDRLASMYLPGRSGAECESRWLNCEDPLINHSPWTVLEDKKLLFIIQERGIYNWIDIAITLGTHRTPFQCLARYQRSLNPHILNKDWTEDEDARLCTAVESFGDNNWQLVASNLEGRTGPQCSNRWRKTLHPDRKKVGRWSVDEDKRLKVAVMLFGAKNWNKIAQFAPGRTQVQCRERWLNCLDPLLKLDPWTKEEDDKLEMAINQHGYSWYRVAACVPRRTDNQCMRRWKRLFPEEVILLREARRMKKTVLVSNFVDRESERPLIGPSDFSSLINLPISEYGNSRSGKKRSREFREENQREGSCDKKLKKSRAKSRRASKEHFSVSLSSAETPFADLSLVPAEPGVSTNTAENGSTKRTRKRVSRCREGPQLKIQRTVSRRNQPDKLGPACRQSLETVPAHSMGNSFEFDSARIYFVPSVDSGKHGTASGTIQGTSSNNNLQIRQSKKFTAKAKARVKETIVTDSKMDVCADEDVPLIEWLHSLAFEARSERLSNKSSRRSGGINQRETYCDDAVSIRTEKPKAKRKRSSKESIENDATGCGDNMLLRNKNDEPCYLVSKRRDVADQSAEGNDTVQLGHTMVDVSDASAPVPDGPRSTEGLPAYASNSTNEIHCSTTSRAATDDDTLLGFMLQRTANRKQQCLDGESAALS